MPAPFASFLQATLDGTFTVPETFPVPGGQATWRGEGILSLAPRQWDARSPALVLSAGIHGNETAPIELLDALISDILGGRQNWNVPLLAIFGNPPAMRQQARFIDFNLNRLFMDGWQTRPESEYETGRAAELAQHLDAFLHNTRPAVHYDLHTAIRPSAIEKFALWPWHKGEPCPDQEMLWLGAAGIEALLSQHAPARTFSAHSRRRWGIPAFTLELGKVRPFGENDLSRLNALDRVLRDHLSGQVSPPADSALPARFRVVEEVLNTGEGFRLCVTPETPNFTRYAEGELVWEDHRTRWHAPSPVHIVFPNPDVPPGQRAALLVQPE
ncbi:succinylglutamate desuccinylase [Hahella sp. SMD15-11]|uniref:Succinylglutamate desuccinylase n=1 Tax=Thermohahella caldifontis TaxID=3142973 RepID=A0AB39UWG7_9GAMM